MDITKLCLGCMKEKNSLGVCTHCGFDKDHYQAEPHHLPLNTILNGKYIVGRVLGEGGFGITYIGLDLNLDMPVAIKEYYPNGFVSRNSTIAGTNNITKFQGEKFEFFEKGLKRFLDEARSVAKFYEMSGIAAVKDFFNENETAYIVMEYVDGINLKEYLKRQGGKITVDVVLSLMKPVIESLEQVHNEGIIHRDISPDNIMINSKGTLKLLDFGAARNYENNENKSLSIMLKPGYAPEEQYRTQGTQGSFTDVYALCATMYKMITGKTPPESLERRVEDSIEWPSQLGIKIDDNIEQVLKKGLAVNATDRIQNMKELASCLYDGKVVNLVTVTNIGDVKSEVKQVTVDKKETNSISKKISIQNNNENEINSNMDGYWKKHALSLAIIFVLGLISVGVTFYIKNNELKNLYYSSQSNILYSAENINTKMELINYEIDSVQ